MIRTCFFRFLTILTALSALGISAFAQTGWVQQSPFPVASSLDGVAWTSPTHGFIAGEDMAFRETTDGGATWRSIELGGFPDNPLYYVYFRDASNGFVGGNNNEQWRTTDGGATWQQITPFFGGSWRHMDFVSSTVGFLGANGAVVRTQDGGVTWALMSGYPDCPVAYGMDFLDAQVGLIGGNRVSGSTDSGPGIFKTTDAGVTWVRKFSNSANDLLWLDNSTAIAIVGATIYRSVDAGETWNPFSVTNISTGLVDMEPVDAATIVGISSSGAIWRSADSGLTWTHVYTGIGGGTAISFADSQNGAAVGQGGIIHRTSDGGTTWNILNSGIGAQINDLEMFSDTFGLAVTYGGYVFRTVNGGARWEVSSLPAESLNTISFVDQDFAVVAGSGGVVYKTTNGGQTWESIGYPRLSHSLPIKDVKFINRDVGWVTGLDYSYGTPASTYRTTDGGATWAARISTSVGTGNRVEFVDLNHGWLMSLGGLGQRTIDGGALWEQMELPSYFTSPQVNDLRFANENEGWAVGAYGYIAHTADGGRNWELQESGTTEETFSALDVLSPTEAFATTYAGGVYHTNDAGATWTRYFTPAEHGLSTITARPNGRVWVGGYGGLILTSVFNVPPPAMMLTLNPPRVVGGNTSQGTITLGSPAPAGGADVLLSSSNTSVATTPASVTVPAGATSATFTINTQALPPSPEDTTVTIMASWNGNTRQAKLAVAPEVHCTFSLSPVREDFGASGGMVNVKVTAPNGCPWTASSNRSWITVTSGASGTGNGTVTLVIAPNTISLTRFTSLTIAGERFAIFQAGAGGCDYSISPTTQSFGVAGGTGSIDITTTLSGCDWAARSNDSWITITSATSGLGNGTVNFLVAANPDASPRTGSISMKGKIFTVTQTGAAKFDFDGDQKTDIALWRPSDGMWHILKSAGGTAIAQQWGNQSLGDVPAPGDYDGDGRTDQAVWRSSTGTWYVLSTLNGSMIAQQWGLGTDKPAPGDYDGDGKADFAVFRPSNGIWYILQSTNNQMKAAQWGLSTDKPVPGDYDGDGKTDIAVFRPGTGVWYILQSTNNQMKAAQWGLSTDKPVAGDYDGDRKADIAVWRPSDGYWYIFRSSNGTLQAQPWGINGDTPQPGDFDGDGKFDLSVWRSSNSTWYIQRSTNGVTMERVFGFSSDMAVSSANVP